MVWLLSMYRDPSGSQINGRVGWFARWQVIEGIILIAVGTIGFLLSWNFSWLILALVGAGIAWYWNPIRRKFDDGRGEPKQGDFFPGGKF